MILRPFLLVKLFMRHYTRIVLTRKGRKELENRLSSKRAKAEERLAHLCHKRACLKADERKLQSLQGDERSLGFTTEPDGETEIIQRCERRIKRKRQELRRKMKAWGIDETEIENGYLGSYY